MQIGWRHFEDKSYIGTKDGYWKNEWYVIASLHSDPVIVDLNSDELKIGYSFHGFGAVDWYDLCENIEQFTNLIIDLNKLSKIDRTKKSYLTNDEILMIKNKYGKAIFEYWLNLLEDGAII